MEQVSSTEYTGDIRTYEEGVAGPLEEDEDVREDELVVCFDMMEPDVRMRCTVETNLTKLKEVL